MNSIEQSIMDNEIRVWELEQELLQAKLRLQSSRFELIRVAIPRFVSLARRTALESGQETTRTYNPTSHSEIYREICWWIGQGGAIPEATPNCVTLTLPNSEVVTFSFEVHDA